MQKIEAVWARFNGRKLPNMLPESRSVLDLSEPSICIPRARRDTNAQQVKQVLEKVFGEGCISQVDERELRDISRDQSYFKRYFIHFHEWPSNARESRQKLLDGRALNIVYSEPWFWKCSAARPRGAPRLPRPRDPLPSPHPRS